MCLIPLLPEDFGLARELRTADLGGDGAGRRCRPHVQARHACDALQNACPDDLHGAAWPLLRRLEHEAHRAL